MALDYDKLTSITRDEFIPKVVDNILDSDPLFMRMLRKAEKGTGRGIVQPIKYAKNEAGGWYSKYDKFKTNEDETRTAARFDWKYAYQSIVLNGPDKAQNKGKEGIIDLVKQEMEEAETDMKDKMITSLYSDGTGSSSKEMTGLGAAVDDGTSIDSYGGIARTSYSWWASYKATSVGALTLDALATAYTGVSSGKDVPTIMVTTEDIWNSFEALQEPKQRFNIMMDGYATMDKDGVGKGKELGADAGFKTLFFRGTPIVSSEYCTSGYLYLLNEKYLKFKVLPNAKYKSDKFGFCMTDMKEPIDQDGEVAQMLWYGNLVGSQCRRQGVMQDVS